MIRQFWIQNAQGICWDLNGLQGVWFSEPEGLGARWGVETADLGNGFFAELETDAVPSEPVVGNLQFLPPAGYETYRRFIRFLTSSRQLDLLYRPFGTEIFQLRGRFEFLQKGEKSDTGLLTVPASFIPFSPWYRPQSLSLVMEAAGANQTVFPFTFTPDLTFASSLIGSWAVELQPAGDFPASLVFIYAGAANRPILTLTGANSGTEYGRCAVETAVTGLLYSSQYINSYVNDGSGADLTDDLTPAYSPFFRIPTTEPCILRLQATGDLTGSATVAVNYFYRSV